MPDPSVAEHEQGLALFVARQRRERFLASLTAGGKARAKELARLHNGPELDERWIDSRPAPALADEFVEAIHARLADLAPNVNRAYVVSGDPDLDGRFVDLDDALHEATLSDEGCFFSIVPGRVAVYTGELVDTVLILARESAG